MAATTVVSSVVLRENVMYARFTVPAVSYGDTVPIFGMNQGLFAIFEDTQTAAHVLYPATVSGLTVTIGDLNNSHSLPSAKTGFVHVWGV